MSGTSLDGIDAALVELDGSGPDDLGWRLEHFVTEPYTAEQREEIRGTIEGGTPAALCRLNARLGRWFAAAVLRLCEEAGRAPAEIDLIGCHGQTIWHSPPDEHGPGATLQLGSAAEIAEHTGIPVVSDFRSRDMAAGGQGAPLVPWADRALFAVPGRTRALQNIGGMANVTRVPPRGDPAPLLAFDTGPGVALMDAAAELATGGRSAFDLDGELAARGRADHKLVDALLSDPYFRRPPPKSTGREYFGRDYVARIMDRRRPATDSDWADLLATLTELTARSVADAYGRWVLPLGVDEVVLTGGGSRNPVLARRIGELLAPVPVRGGDALGLDPDAKEAVAFAVLAWAHALGLPGNVPEATGAVGPRVLGSWTPVSGLSPRPAPASGRPGR